MLFIVIMEILRGKQIINRRKRKVLSFLKENKEKNYIAVVNIFNKIVGNFARRIRSNKVILIAAGFFFISVTAAIIMIQVPAEDLILHNDNNIESILFSYVSPEFEGRGSGEYPETISSLITSLEPVEYKVRAGDTISEIADLYNREEGTLISYNYITNVRNLQAGSIIRIPNMDGVPYVVQDGDSLESIARENKMSINTILDTNNLESDILHAGTVLFLQGVDMPEEDYKRAIGTLFIFPTVRNARLTSGFGMRTDPFTGTRRMHYGLDLACATGNRVIASMAGVVSAIGESPLGYGKYIVIAHSGGFQTLYAHLNKILVRKGQRVNQEQKIGEIGNTGRSTGSHLHFSIYQGNKPIDPASLVTR